MAHLRISSSLPEPSELGATAPHPAPPDASSLADLAGFALRASQGTSLQAVIDMSLDCLRKSGWGGGKASALDEFLAQIALEEEGSFSPAKSFGISIDAEAKESRSIHDFLTRVASSYLKATAYLIPIIAAFCQCLTQFAGDRRIVLFLRDAIVFWPLLRRNSRPSQPPRVDLLAFSRRHAREHLPPESVTEHGDGLRSCSATSLRGCVLVDVGLWGSLIEVLMSEGRMDLSSDVIFFGSRNPFIEGWLNAQSASSALRRPKADLGDLILLVDTLESLLKPFSFEVVDVGGQRRVSPRVADPVSIACSLAFLWAIGRAGTGPGSKARNWHAHFANAKRTPENWMVRCAVPPSESGYEFLKRWAHGPLPPRNRTSGFAL